MSDLAASRIAVARADAEARAAALGGLAGEERRRVSTTPRSYRLIQMYTEKRVLDFFMFLI